jgi:hypothetical protein
MSKPNNADTVQALQIAAAKQALQDVTEAVAEMKIEIARLRAELKTALAERDEARQEICNSKKRRPKTHLDYARKRGWNCFWVDYSKQEETP